MKALKQVEYAFLFSFRTFGAGNWTKCRRCILFALTCFLVLFCDSIASAKNYYVNSASGNDANSGETPTSAWRNLTTSIAKMSDGDSLDCSGSWTVTSQLSVATPNITINGNGAATIDIRPLSSSGTLIFRGSNTVFRGFVILGSATPTAAVQALIGVFGNNSIMADCVIRDFAEQAVDDEIIILISASACTFTNLSFYNIRDRDIFRAWGSFNRWISCNFSNCTNPNAGKGGDPHADIFQTWWTGTPVWSNVIERCYFVNSSQATFQLKGTPDNINCNPDREGYWTIRNNIFNNCKTWPVISTDQFRFYNNLLYQSGQGNYPLFLVSDPCNTRGRYFNNVFVNTYSQTGSSPSYGYNAFTVAAASWGGVGDFVTTEAACRFVNPVGGDFRLQAGSVLIGRGLNLSGDANMTTLDADGYSRPAIGAWDLGPYQYNSAGNNRAPVVNAGTNQTVILPTNFVTLVGAATDPEGGAVSLTWSQVGGPGTAAFSTLTSAVTTVTLPLLAGNYSFRLTANDRTNTSMAEVLVTVVAPLPVLVASFEAENGTITAPFVKSSTAVSQPVESGIADGGRAVYQFSVPAHGNYLIRALLNAPSAAADSFFVGIDDTPTDPHAIWDVSPVTNGYEYRWVSWRGNGSVQTNEFNPKAFPLSAGPHTLIIIGREASISLDRIEIRAVAGQPAAPLNLRVLN